MHTTWNEKQLENANRFTSRIEDALKETGLAKEHFHSYILGWLYGQLRQRLSKKETRLAFEQAIAECEKQLDNVAKV